MNNILLLTLLQILLMQNSFAFNFDKHQASFQAVVLPLKAGDVIDISGHFKHDGKVSENHFDLEAGNCQWLEKKVSSCSLYNFKINLEANEVKRRTFTNGVVTKHIDQFKPFHMTRGRFRYILKVKPDHLEVTFNNQKLKNWDLDIPIDKIETFTLYGDLLVKSYKIHRGYSMWLTKDYKGDELDVECS